MFLDNAVSTLVSGGMMAVPASGHSRPLLRDGAASYSDRTVRTQAEMLLMSPLPVLTQVLRQQLVQGAARSAEVAGNLLDLSMGEAPCEDAPMSDGTLAWDVQQPAQADDATSSTMVALMAAAALLQLRAH